MTKVYKHDEIEKIMQEGLHKDLKTGLSYFTGYSYNTLYDWDQYFDAIILLRLGWDVELIRNGVRIFLAYQQNDGFIPRTVPIRKKSEEGNEHVKPFLAQIVLLLYRHTDEIDWITKDIYTGIKKALLYWLQKQFDQEKQLAFWRSAPHTGMDNQHDRAGWWDANYSLGVDLNSYLIRECRALAVIANLIGKNDDELEFTQWAKVLSEAINKTLWDDRKKFYFDFDREKKMMNPTISIAGITPLWAGIANPQQATDIIEKYILNPSEFWRPFPVSALSASDPGYSEYYKEGDLGCNWRAMTWIPTNFITIQSMRSYGYVNEATNLARITHENVLKLGNFEYYSSDSVLGKGLYPFWGWSLLGYFINEEIPDIFD